MALASTIFLKTGDEIAVSDSSIVNNGVSVSMSVCSFSSFDIGSFNAATLDIQLFDDEALEHEFDGAKIVLALSEESDIEGEEAAITQLGTYYVDGTKTQRRKNIVKLTAQDASARFDIALSDEIRGGSYTPYSALAAICGVVGVNLANIDLSEFPNNGVTVSFASASVQTYRDAVMWVAQLVCGNALINRDELLEIRRAKFLATGGEGSEIIADYESDGTDRVSIDFSDVRTFPKYLAEYSAGKPKEYTSGLDPIDAQAREGMISLPENPIIESKTEAEADEINTAWLSYIDGFAARTIRAKMLFNPSIQLGYTIRFKGGSVDIRRSIIGVVTSVTWRYRGVMTVQCAAPQAVKAV